MSGLFIWTAKKIIEIQELGKNILKKVEQIERVIQSSDL